MANTIFAQCSAPGKAGVAIFRVSGPFALNSLSKLITHDYKMLEPRKLYLRKIYIPQKQKLIDEAMVVYFSGNASFTGEDSVEIYTHGSLAVIKLLHQALASMEDVRIAEPGEFAKRAFLNGKMDLTSAEGLADLIEAETELQHKQAIAQLGGALERIYENWRKTILKLISLMEAYIDFPDENIPDSVINEVEEKIHYLINEIKIHLDDNNRGERLRSGIKLAIIGKPNAGKSSLINYIMRRELAIVSNIAGTTRDIIEGYIDIGGYPIILQDTAGINLTSEDIIEQKGISKAWHAAFNADIKILIIDATSNYVEDIKIFEDIIDQNTIILLNKIDLDHKSVIDKRIIQVSIKQSIGLENIYNNIIAIAEKIAAPSDNAQLTRSRHRGQLETAVENLTKFSINDDLVLATEDLRMTARAISNITGKITVEEILGEIFSSFCIGK
ncbi:MAG: tRNA uridine-5-carboxymethylaminomethyl(34) synthesis GTPase MnmE [Rickettsiaceae bacterium]|nr:tRNA uridine-5-carboxymethylaminomethyl(34) synthesis GTPase MnmE [Rickettsiaceae bacterium]